MELADRYARDGEVDVFSPRTRVDSIDDLDVWTTEPKAASDYCRVVLNGGEVALIAHGIARYADVVPSEIDESDAWSRIDPVKVRVVELFPLKIVSQGDEGSCL